MAAEINCQCCGDNFTLSDIIITDCLHEICKKCYPTQKDKCCVCSRLLPKEMASDINISKYTDKLHTLITELQIYLSKNMDILKIVNNPIFNTHMYQKMIETNIDELQTFIETIQNNIISLQKRDNQYKLTVASKIDKYIDLVKEKMKNIYICIGSDISLNFLIRVSKRGENNYQITIERLNDNTYKLYNIVIKYDDDYVIYKYNSIKKSMTYFCVM